MGTIAEKLQYTVDAIDGIEVALQGKGVETTNKTLAEYPALIDSIPTGGFKASKFYINKCILTKDNGYIIEKIPIEAGEVVDLGAPQDVEASTNWGVSYHIYSHPAMTATSWASSIPIVDNKFTAPDDILTDFHVGCIYETADNLNWYVISDFAGLRAVSADNTVVSNYTASVGVWLSNKITTINDKSFSGWDYLLSISIPDSVTKIGRSNVSGEVFRDTKIKYINIPSNTFLYDAVFSRCQTLLSTNIAPPNTILREETFNLCLSLESIHIPYGVTTIEDNVFGSVVMSMIEVPYTVTNIGNLFYTSNMPRVTVFKPTSPPISSFDAFQSIILVPVGSEDAYRNATNYTGAQVFSDTPENRLKFGV